MFWYFVLRTHDGMVDTGTEGGPKYHCGALDSGMPWIAKPKPLGTDAPRYSVISSLYRTLRTVLAEPPVAVHVSLPDATHQVAAVNHLWASNHARMERVRVWEVDGAAAGLGICGRFLFF